MALTIRDESSNDLTIKPYRILQSTKYMVKPVLYPVVVSIGKQSIHVEIFFKVLENSSDIAYLKNISDSVEVVSSDHDEVPLGTYYIETIEMRHETNSISVVDCRISMFKYE